MMQKPDGPRTTAAGKTPLPSDASNLPTEDARWFQIGEGFRQQAHFARAIDAYRRVPPQSPERPAAQHRLANALKAVGLLGGR